MDTKIKTAVIGLGRIGWKFHIPSIVANKKFDLIAVSDISKERLKYAEKKYGIKGYTDLSELIKNEHPQLVVIATPTNLHKEHAILALNAGCDVFLDKPMAKNLDEVNEIYECAKKSGHKLMVYQPHRAFAEANIIKSIIASGKIGKVFMIKRAVSDYTRRDDWQAFTKFGGGMLNNYGAHYIDQLLYILNEKARRINCKKYRIASAGDADDVVKIVIETDNNTLLDLDINMASAFKITPWMIFGEYGTVTLWRSGRHPAFKLKYYDPDSIPKAKASEKLSAEKRRYSNDVKIPWTEEIINVTNDYEINFYDKCYEYYAENKPPFVPLEETVKVMEIIDRCHKDSLK